jgi:hypothetical protein
LPFQILVVAKELPILSFAGGASANHASIHAGAHVRPIPAYTPELGREARWLKRCARSLSVSQVARQP